ncbi:putative bifunctional diguanylate cyclase/phosphodiesterase [Pseudohalioglobus lutimaris]|uniref:GGDEF domain-containing protein n=1 Tax=Pseudohalioglobus lutimaris TaxID=1737061 RepID=A0A2N5X2T6_9GAMM|nr:EAL domain-containing protein [Pseudohalioglobus lutimaris]PLW68770.1 hypothetical protein C0039_10885 [Pseudohalioglobus lutimaris]
MRISVRLGLTFAVTLVAIGVISGIATALREFELETAALASRAEANLRGQPGLQYFIYQSDRAKLEQALAQFLSSDSGTTAQVFNGLGELLASATRAGANRHEPDSFTGVRRSMMTLDGGIRFFDAGTGAPLRLSLWQALGNSHAPIYQTLPVLTKVNTGAAGLTATDFTVAITGDSANASQRVIGYVHILSDPAVLIEKSLAAGLRVMLFHLLLAMLGGLLAWLIARRVTRPLRELALMADAVAAGEINEPIKVGGGEELEDITRLFNGVIEGIRDSKKVHEIDKRLLSLKVQERSSQLSESSQALDKAMEEANKTRDQLEQVANYDDLTKLPNRHLLTEQLGLLLKLNQRHGHTLALLFVDLDDFKRVYDSLGMGAGDKLLVEVSKRITRTVRDSDSVGYLTDGKTGIDVARLGGDEFTIILNQLDSADSAAVVAGRLIDNLTAPLTIAGHKLSLHPSVGIAIAPTDGKDVESLLKAASTAKYHAKQDGSETRYRFYRSNMGHQGAERLRLESDLRTALEQGGLSLAYQPQIDTNSGSVIGAEALLRWEHPQLGQIPPAKFVNLAEKAGLMEQLGDWVLVEACRQVRRFNDEGVKLGKVAINVSALQFSMAFVEKVNATLAKSGIEAHQLELGLSEAIMSSNETETVGALKALRDSGVYLSVDDFGTGYSPLHYLSQYPLDELKIDRSFLLEADRTDTGAKLVVAILSLARSLGLKALATGVETEAQFHFLTANGANLIQGYLFSEPVSAEALKPMLAPWHFVDQVQQLSATAPE